MYLPFSYQPNSHSAAKTSETYDAFETSETPVLSSALSLPAERGRASYTVDAIDAIDGIDTRNDL